MQFVTQGDKEYYPTIDAAANQIGKIYSNPLFHIYDSGLTKNQRTSLQSYPHVRVESWEIEFESSFISSIIRKIEEKSQNIKYTNFLLSSFIGYTYPHKQRRFEYFANQKMYVIKDCMENNMRKEDPLIYIDADVIPIKPINNLFSRSFDIAVTLRPKKERKIIGKDTHPHLLNSGVILFSSVSENTLSFVDHWIYVTKKMETVEQTSLGEIVEMSFKKTDESLLNFENYYSVTKIGLEDYSIDLLILPGTIYNYPKIEEGISNVKFAHFKSGRYKSDDFSDIISKYRKN